MELPRDHTPADAVAGTLQLAPDDEAPCMVAREVSLAVLFGGTHAFRIPTYQRSFAWDRDDASRLLGDIDSARLDVDRHASQPYFLGPIIVHEQIENGRAVLDVIDGQQRLIVLTLILAIARDQLAGRPAGQDGATAIARLLEVGGDPWTSRIAPRDRSEQAFLDAFVLPPGATRRPHKAIEDHRGAEAIRSCRDALARELRQRDPAEIARLVAYMTQACRVLLVRTRDFDYAYQIFLSHNDRGKNLSAGDILRAELSGPLTSAERGQVESVLAELDRYDRTETVSGVRPPVRGKTFFSHLRAMLDGQGTRMIEDLRVAIQRRGGPRRFVGEVFLPAAQAYFIIQRPLEFADRVPPQIIEALLRLRVFQQMNDDDWVASALLAFQHYREDADGLAAFLSRLEHHAVALAVLASGYQSRQRRYRQLNGRFLSEPAGRVDLDAVFALSREDRETVVAVMTYGLYEVDKRLCRFLLLRLEADIVGRPLADYLEFFTSDAYSVEHVLPNGRSVPDCWHALFPNKRSMWAEHLGNLCVVPAELNGLLAQLCFEEKRTALADRRPDGLSLTDDVARAAEWTPAAVEARTEMLMARARRLWGLDDSAPAREWLTGKRLRDIRHRYK